MAVKELVSNVWVVPVPMSQSSESLAPEREIEPAVMVELFKVMDLSAIFVAAVAVNEVRLKLPVIVAMVLFRTMEPWVEAFAAVSVVVPPLRLIVPVPEKVSADIESLIIIVPLFAVVPEIVAAYAKVIVPLETVRFL